MPTIDPKNTPTADVHQFLLGAVSPRPIAFASTIDETGKANLAPYSFFNCFSSNPPIVVFSSNRKVSDNTTKDTLHNIEKTKEVVINVVNYQIVRQMAVTSIAYPADVSEFEKAGLTPIPSDLVSPFRVKESPAQLECKVKDIIALGDQGGAGHLIICEVLRMHIDDAVLDEKGKIDPHKIDLMGRMGRAFYVRASGAAIHKIFQPVTQLGIGFDQLPASVRNSRILSGNDLGQLAALTALPNSEAIEKIKTEDPKVQAILAKKNPSLALHQYAKEMLTTEEDQRNYALALAIIADQIN
ncbi:MAG: flavin reductase family protein [Bacteroidota bacterium]